MGHGRFGVGRGDGEDPTILGHHAEAARIDLGEGLVNLHCLFQQLVFGKCGEDFSDFWIGGAVKLNPFSLKRKRITIRLPNDAVSRKLSF